MYHSNLQFLNNVLVIIIKTKIHFHKAYATLADFGYPISVISVISWPVVSGLLHVNKYPGVSADFGYPI